MHLHYPKTFEEQCKVEKLAKLYLLKATSSQKEYYQYLIEKTKGVSKCQNQN